MDDYTDHLLKAEVLLLRTRTLRYVQAGGGDGGEVASNTWDQNMHQETKNCLW